MTVTRRELLTAASAIGLAAGLSRETESAFQAPINPTWDVIPSTEAALLRRAAELVGFSGSDHFRSFDQSDYEEFFRVFETNHHATVNGGYLGVPSVDNLKMVYSIRLRRDQTADNEGDPAGVDFVLHAFGGQYRTPEVSTTELYTQIRGWLNNLGQTGEKRTKVY